MIPLVTALVLLQLPPCQAGQVVGVERGREYRLNICSVGSVALRGVEPPLYVANGVSFREGGGPVSGEVLGVKDIGPEAVAFLSQIVAGRRVTIVYDGFRMGDPGGRRYAYVFLPDKTLLNAELIRRGYGYADVLGTHPRLDEFRALEAGARRAKVGLWATFP
jgi:endonuclease YncB( thermonuclease family)